MAQMIPLFLAEDEENTSSMASTTHWGVNEYSRDLNDPLACYDDLEHVRRLRFSRASISQFTELIANYLNFTERFYAAPPPHAGLCGTWFFRFWNILYNLWRGD